MSEAKGALNHSFRRDRVEAGDARVDMSRWVSDLLVLTVYNSSPSVL